MRKVTTRNILLLLIATAALVLMATAPGLAKQRLARSHVETSKSHVHHARHWQQRRRTYAASRRFVKPRSYASGYHRRAYARPWDSYETDLLFDCLLSQPFVICP